MTQEQRTRLYCCLKACSHCGAQRVEYCISSKGKIWTKGYHCVRAVRSERPTKLGGQRQKYKERYAKLKAQIEAENCNQLQIPS